MSSALIAMSVSYKFSKYILCEEDEKCLNALKNRVERHYPNYNLNVEFIKGDSNKNVNEIIKALPIHSIENKVLRFCFVDPFSLNLKFTTIKKLVNVGKIDFLILLALYMDANRNLFNYISDNSFKVDEFINDVSWREPFLSGKLAVKDFIKFLADKYDENMKNLNISNL